MAVVVQGSQRCHHQRCSYVAQLRRQLYLMGLNLGASCFKYSGLRICTLLA